jgi:hypothetical protein|tara:strand:- start:347 stop:757 length:411 start_codon:yes stop_codon:yes gene_type:complete
VLIEVLLGVVLFFLVINLIISWLNLNLSVQTVTEIQEFLDNHSNPSNMIQVLSRKIGDIEQYLADLMKVLGNPFQMLAATHGQRILDKFFPPKIEGIPDHTQRSQEPLISAPSSDEVWQEQEADQESPHEDVKTQP